MVVKLPVVSRVDRAGILACTKTALQLLASPADFQVRYYPDFVLVADELALDFDHWRSVFLSNFATELTPEQTLAFAVIDDRFQALSSGGGEYNEQFWTDGGLRESSDWVGIRRMATRALSLLGWPLERPDTILSVYVKGCTARFNAKR
jgi:hypothetical protein